MEMIEAQKRKILQDRRRYLDLFPECGRTRHAHIEATHLPCLRSIHLAWSLAVVCRLLPLLPLPLLLVLLLSSFSYTPSCERPNLSVGTRPCNLNSVGRHGMSGSNAIQSMQIHKLSINKTEVDTILGYNKRFFFLFSLFSFRPSFSAIG